MQGTGNGYDGMEWYGLGRGSLASIHTMRVVAIGYASINGIHVVVMFSIEQFLSSSSDHLMVEARRVLRCMLLAVACCVLLLRLVVHSGTVT